MKNDTIGTGLLRKKDIEKALENRLADEARKKVEGLTEPLFDKRRVLIILIGSALVNTFVLGIVDVVAVSGFIGDTGIENLPWLWVAELSLNLLISTTVMQLIDKVSRVKMMRVLVTLLFVTYLVLAGLFFLNVSAKILYPIMYLIYP